MQLAQLKMFAAFSLMAALAGCGGGGSSGSTVAPAPVITSLKYSPSTAQVNSGASGKGSGTMTITYTTSADIASIQVTDSAETGTFTIPVQNAAGMKSGTLIASIGFPTTTVGAFNFTSWLVDANGNSSNKLSGSIAIASVQSKANAGSNFVAATGSAAALDGSGSNSTNGTAITYLWSLIQKPANSAASLLTPNAVNPQFTPDVVGVYKFQLTVNDTFGVSAPSVVSVTAILPGTLTLGSTQASVQAIQGTPIGIDIQSILGYTQFNYDQLGNTYIRISTTAGNVISWNNYNGNLKVIMVVGNNTTTATAISVGSSQDDVIRIQGTPIGIDIETTLGYTQFNYDQLGNTYIRIATTTGNVISWNNYNGSLKVQ